MDEKKIIEQLKLIFPNAEIKTLQESGMSFAFEVNNSIIRVPKNEYAKNGYIIEEKVLSYLHNIITVTQIPTIQIMETPFFYTIHKKIDGLYWNGKEYSLKSDKEKDALAYDCAKFFYELHSSDVSKINAELTGMRPIMQNMEKYLSQYFTVQEMEKANRIVEPLFSLPKEDNVLIHNDFYTDNFFVNKDYHLQGVIDFGNCAFLNYNFEFRKIVSHEEGEHDFWKRIIRYYEELSGRKIDIEIIRKIDIYNYVRFLVYFSKFPEVHETKILVRENWEYHIQHVRDKLEKL